LLIAVAVMVAVLAGFAPLAAAAAALALAFAAGPAAFVPDGRGDDFHDLDRCGWVIAGDYQVTASGELSASRYHRPAGMLRQIEANGVGPRGCGQGEPEVEEAHDAASDGLPQY
jgi:hypothetical protein